MKKIFISYLILTGLVGCGLMPSGEFSSNNKKDYLRSKNGPNLVINKPLTDANTSDFYQLPDQKKIATISIKPPVVQTRD